MEDDVQVLFFWVVSSLCDGGPDVMIDRNCWGHSYSTARGEILGFAEDEPLRKHLPKMFSLIKNES